MAEEEQNTAQNPQIQLPEHAESLQQDNAQDLHPVRVEQTAEQEQPDLHPVRVEQTAEQEQPDLHPVRVEQTAETANTVLPAVRGNAMPERAQEARTTEDKENSVTNDFVKFTQRNSPDNARALFNSLQDLMTDYQMQGLSGREIQEKMSNVLSSAYDMGISMGINSDALKANITQLSETVRRHFAEANQEGMTVVNNVAQMDSPTVNRSRFRDDMDIQDAEIIEELPNEPVAPTNESDGNETDDAPVTPANENEGNEEDNAPVAPANENEGNEEDNAPAAPANENEGNEGDNAPVTPANENQGTFGFIENEPEKENTPSTENGPAAEPAKTSDLKQQLLNTAFKNRYMLVEAENEEPQRMCPFAQLKVRTIEDKSDDEKNPYVKMELESGNRIYNRPNQVDVHYETFVTKDENGQTVRKPQITFEDCMAAVRVGMEKGWTSATLSGPDAYKEQMYLAMCAMGMKVVGYEPSEELKKEGERLAKLHAVDRDHAASVDQRFDALEAARKEAGIKEPEEIGKEFIDNMKERGLGYTPPVQNNENDSNESDGNDTAGTPPVQTNESDGNDTAGTPPAQTHESNGNDTAGTPAAQTNESNGNDTAGTPPAQTNESDGNDTTGTPPAQTNESEGNDTTGTPVAPVIENEGQEAVQQPQQLQLPEHVENRQQEAVQQPQQLQLPAHEEQQQPQTAALVLVTPEIQNKVEAVTQASTTALAKTDPAKAQQAAAQIAATPGISNQLKLIGDTANEAKGNDVRAAQQQHQQETALVLAARNNNHTK